MQNGGNEGLGLRAAKHGTWGRWLAMMLDPDGLPRAWGSAKDPATAEQEARRQLNAYRTRRIADGLDVPREEDFTVKIEKVK